MIDTSQFKSGLSIVLDNELHTIVEFQHVKPGKGGAFVRTKLRSMRTGNVIERTFRSGEKFEDAFIEDRGFQFLYRAGDDLHFMDHTTYEEITISVEKLGKQVGFLKENMEVTASFHNGQLLEVVLPLFVEMKVEHTDPGLKGDTAKSGMKPATLETGATIQVPLFLESGESIKIDTRTGVYVSRA